MFGRKRTVTKKRPEQFDKMMFGYDFALEDVDQILGKVKELKVKGMVTIERGKNSFEIDEIQNRFFQYRELMPRRKSEIEIGNVDFRLLSKEINRIADEIKKIAYVMKFRNHETAVGCLFVWAVLDTQADEDEGLFNAPNN